MRKTTLSVPIDSLQRVRVTCTRKKCDWSMELPVHQLFRVKTAKCPICDLEFGWQAGDSDPFTALRDALRLFDGIADRARVEFVVPDEPAPDKTAAQ